MGIKPQFVSVRLHGTGNPLPSFPSACLANDLLTNQSILLCSSSLAIWPIPGRSMGFLLPPLGCLAA